MIIDINIYLKESFMSIKKNSKLFSFDYGNGIYYCNDDTINPTISDCKLHPNCDGCIQSTMRDCTQCLLYGFDNQTQQDYLDYRKNRD